MSREGGRASRPFKTTITCRTCGVTASFYSTIGVGQFKMEHAGHDVVERESSAAEAREDERKALREEMVRFQRPAPVKLPKIVVELVMFPALAKPVFRIRGISKDNQEAFVQVLVQEQAERVREILARGQLGGQGPGDQVFVWDPEAIEFTDAAKRSLRFPSRSPEMEATERYGPPPTARRLTEPAPKPTSSEEGEEVEDAEDRVFPSARPSSPREAGPEERVRASGEPSVGSDSGKGRKDAVADTFEKADEEAAEPEAGSDEAVREEAPAVTPAPVAEGEVPLLVSKSWYVQEGQKNEKEAARISKVLRAFRWKIEPAYTIRLIVDDILSIESSKNEISGALAKRIEGAGYRLSAVTSEGGNLVAWFKRTPSPDAPSPDQPGRPSKQPGRSSASKEAGQGEPTDGLEEEDVDL